MTRAILAALAFLTLLTTAPTTARAQETAVRFTVTQVGDTTFTFRVGDQVWVRQGLRGIVVDPRQQDVLVARFRVTRVANGQANAVITGWVDLLGGRQSARTIHFLCAWTIVAFVAVHVFQVIVTGFWNNLRSMITGRYRIPQAKHDA